jgi:hypothetical protein
MYQLIDNTLCITVNDWKEAGLTENCLWKDSESGLLSIKKRGIRGNTLIDVSSIKRPERKKRLEEVFGKIEDIEGKKKEKMYEVKVNSEARNYYVNYRTVAGEELPSGVIEEYVKRAEMMDALRSGMRRQIEARATAGRRLVMKDFWEERLAWWNKTAQDNKIKSIYSNTRSLERAFNNYMKDGYESIIHKNFANDKARKVSKKMEKLFLALYRTEDKPFVNRVHELYMGFVRGEKEFYDKTTGESFNPEEFRYKGKPLDVSVATVWNYLKDVVNNTSIYADRNGNFDYANSRRPKHHRHIGEYSLSKISMDDVAMSRKSNKGWVYKYMAVDVVSGYWFRPAYIIGKPTAHTVIESFRDMFCELTSMGLPMPGEIEVEHHLMADIDWLNELFPMVRFCSSPTEKRAEHNIKSLKWGTAKREGHTRGRWYAKSEAYRSVRYKVDGDYKEKEYDPQTIIIEDLIDIEKHNNELHPLQNTYPGMTRKDVLINNTNPSLKPIEKWHLYRYIGNETETSIRNNDYCRVNNEEYEITDYNTLRRLESNKNKITAYWLPKEDGEVEKVYLWQDDRFIGEGINRKQFSYNECAIERTQEDNENMLYQEKRVAKFDKFVKDERKDIPKIGIENKEEAKQITNIKFDVMENEQPKGYEQDDGDMEDYAKIDWAEKGRINL